MKISHTQYCKNRHLTMCDTHLSHNHCRNKRQLLIPYLHCKTIKLAEQAKKYLHTPKSTYLLTTSLHNTAMYIVNDSSPVHLAD